MLFFVLFVIALSISVYYLSRPDKKYKHFEKIPYGKGYLPIIGNLHTLFFKNILHAVEELAQHKTCILWEGPYPIYVTMDPKELKIIFNNSASMHKNSKFEYLRPVFGKSIIMAEVDFWRRNRKSLSKAFHQHLLDNFVQVFYQKSCVLLDILATRTDDSENLFNLFEKFTMDTFLLANIGVNLDVMKSEDNAQLVHNLERGQEIVVNRLFKPILWNKFIFYWFGNGFEMLDLIKLINIYLGDIIKKKRQLRAENQHNTDNKKKALVDLMLDLHDSEENETFTDDYITDEIRIFFYAAADTSASAMNFTCVLLGMYPEIQQKVYDEVVKYVGLTKPFEHFDLPNLKYTEMVINESLRIFPVVPIIGRRAEEELDLGSIIIPAGTDIGVSVFKLHRSEEYYPDPLKFDPDRFLPEEITKRPPYTFIPFSAGPRNCIGWKYAMLLMKTNIANIVRTYQIYSKYKSVEEIKVNSHIVMKPIHKVHCTFTKRN